MVLKAEGVSRRFFRKSKMSNFFFAVKSAELILEPGRFIEITGRSGSGKSTLLNIMAGLLEPTEGKVLLGGEDIYAMDDDRRSRLRNKSIGVIPQGQTGLRSLTVLENVLLPCTMYGGAGMEQRAAELLERVGIAPLADSYPGELSGGEMRRLAIARAMINGPEVILADEPTSDLDDENTVAVLTLLREAADAGAAVLLVTHESGAAAYADEVYTMSDGVLTRDFKSMN